MKNNERTIVKILKEISQERGYEINSFSYDFVFNIKNKDKILEVYGYQFANNSATSSLICCDKNAAYEVLKHNNIPAVEHFFFMSPSTMEKYIGVAGNWKTLTQLLKKYGALVCKNNKGTGGNNVIKVTNESELEIATNKIFKSAYDMAVCPYYDIESEYRLIMLDHKPQLVYEKIIQNIEGDGEHDIATLLLYNKCPVYENFYDYSYIPAKGEKIKLNWKHNLGRGAYSQDVNNGEIYKKLTSLAQKTTKALNINFCSVDIVKTNNQYKVLEVNSGVMCENYASFSEENYKKIKNIYANAIDSYFNQN